MIAWEAALRAAAELAGAGPAVRHAMAEVAREAPAFQNRAFPLSPLPLLIHERAAERHARAAEEYVRLLDKIVGLYLTEEPVRRWYGLDPAAEALVLADRRLAGQVQVCRLDGYLEQGTERPFVLENNADAPAGSLFTSRVNQMVADVLALVGVDPGPTSPLTYTGENSLLGVLALCAAQAGLDEPAHVAVLAPAGSATRESEEMTAAFSRAGVDAYLADPRELRISRGRVYFAGRPADACWNKINTAPWRELVAGDPDLTGRWVRAVSETSFLHVNPFGARYVAESKLSLALPQEPAFSGLFTPPERALATRLLPWGRRVTSRARAVDGTTGLREDLAEHPARYVLKQPYDIRGDGVTIGRASARGAWQDAIGAALADGHLAQEHIAPTSYPTIGEDTSVVAMPVSLDTFVLRGRARGFGSKASLNPRLNVFQGGQKLAVQVIKEHRDAA